MTDIVYLINEAQIRSNGRWLARFAVAGQVVLSAHAVSTPLVLYAIQAGTKSAQTPAEFMREAYIHGPLAPHNLHGVAVVAMSFLFLECVRRLGGGLATADPLGNRTVRHLGSLRWACVALTLAMGVSTEIVMNAGGAPGFGTGFDFSTTPLYAGLLAITGISLVRRIIRQAVILKTENESIV